MTVTWALVTSGYASIGVARYARIPYAATASVTSNAAMRRWTQCSMRCASMPLEELFGGAIEQQRPARHDALARRQPRRHLHVVAVGRGADRHLAPGERPLRLLDVDDRAAAVLDQHRPDRHAH